MDKLTLRSDSAAETPSGQFAVIPKRPSGVTHEGVAWFEFKASVLSDVTRVEWPYDSQVAVIDADIASSMVRNGYARGLTQAEVDRFNAAVDEYNGGEGADLAAKEAKRLEEEEAARKTAEAAAKKKADDDAAAAKKKADDDAAVAAAQKAADDAAKAAKDAADKAATQAAGANAAPAAAAIPPVFENGAPKAVSPLDVTKQTGDNGAASLLPPVTPAKK